LRAQVKQRTPAAKPAAAVSPPAVENASGKLEAPNMATGPIGRWMRRISGRGKGWRSERRHQSVDQDSRQHGCGQQIVEAGQLCGLAHPANGPLAGWFQSTRSRLLARCENQFHRQLCPETQRGIRVMCNHKSKRVVCGFRGLIDERMRSDAKLKGFPVGWRRGEGVF
jgi:hypothetical protein